MKKQQHKTIGILFIIIFLAMNTGCKKQCLCYKGDGTQRYFSKEEVEEQGNGSCTDMKYRAGRLYYNRCEWDL